MLTIRGKKTSSSTTERSKNNTERSKQKSKTLMRGGLKKPHHTAERDNSAQSHKKHLASTTEHKKVLKPAHNQHRAERAHTSTRSSAISRFGNGSNHSIDKKVEPLHVKNAPSYGGSTSHNKHLNSHEKSKFTTHRPPVIDFKQSTPKTAEEHFNRAMASAESHTHALQKSHKSTRKKQKRLAKTFGVSNSTLSASAAVLAVVLLGVFFAWQNNAQISMNIASSRAGFEAKMPRDVPSGFSVNGPIEYDSGIVKVAFSSNVDDRNFSLTEKASRWNSQALVDNHLEANSKQYVQYENRGRTIYVYDQNNATWVNGGVWYQLESQADLSTDQILNIASSL